MKLTISPGHWKVATGARDLLDEVLEARKVVNRVVEILRAGGVKVNHVEDNKSINKRQNLSYLVSEHNKTQRMLDVSIHFNASSRSKEGKGTEVCYYDEEKLASKISNAIAKSGKLRNRGAKQRKELAFLNGTNKPAVLIEVCFVSDEYDAKMYRQCFEDICQAIAKELAAYVGCELTTNGRAKATSVIHTVVDGDTLYGIARKFRVTTNHIKSVNNLKTDVIRPGQKLIIK